MIWSLNCLACIILCSFIQQSFSRSIQKHTKHSNGKGPAPHAKLKVLLDWKGLLCSCFLCFCYSYLILSMYTSHLCTSTALFIIMSVRAVLLLSTRFNSYSYLLTV